MRLWQKATALGLFTACIGLAGNALPRLAGLEVELGLDWLFALRGPRPALDDVVVVTIDRASSDALKLPNEPDKWPRSNHARLVRNLASMGARVIAFDIIFDEPRDAEQDRQFAEAIRDAGNVVLFEYLKKETRPLVDGGGPAAQLSIERRIPPIPELASAAAGLAPFPLPKVPVRVSQFWLFKGGAGDTPTLPVVGLQVYARFAHPTLLDLLQEVHPADDLPPLITNAGEPEPLDKMLAGRTLRAFLQKHPGLAERLLERLEDPKTPVPPETRAVLSRLSEMHSGPASRYLDFYGPPRSITTVPYYQVLGDAASEEAGSLNLEGKAVFVGFSEELQPEQRDGFYTVFSRPDGLDISGVEIAATAFANLLEGRHVEPLEPPLNALAIAFWGFVLGVLLLSLPAAVMVPAAILIAAIYLAAAYQAFAHSALWLPLVVPLLLQLPPALVGSLLWHYLGARQERRNMRKAFGFYLPSTVVDELAASSEDFRTKGEIVYGICLATDAAQYTRLSESVEPERLRSLLNEYYHALFDPVRERGGFISDVVGDSMLAVWASTSADPSLKKQACHAALDIVAQVGEFNRRVEDAYLPTRIGLHCGKLLLGNVGARDHYEYRAVGDTVNTASRIEGLNKQLETHVLAADDVVREVSGLVTRELGRFRLAGKVQPLTIHELVGPADSVTDHLCKRNADFAAALNTFKAQRWEEAMAALQELLSQYGHDGPSRYYLGLCERFAKTPPIPSWDGVVNLTEK